MALVTRRGRLKATGTIDTKRGKDQRRVVDTDSKLMAEKSNLISILILMIRVSGIHLTPVSSFYSSAPFALV
jgi:hypothetical protein